MCVSIKFDTVLKTPSAPLGCSSHQRGKHSEKSLYLDKGHAKDVFDGPARKGSRIEKKKARTSTCAQHAESRVGEPRRTGSIVYSVLDWLVSLPGMP